MRLLFLAIAAVTAWGQIAPAQSTPPSSAIPSPEQFFGFRMGADKKIARYDKIVEYIEKIASLSGRVRVRNLGLTTGGNPYILAEISSESTLRNLDTYRNLERKLYFQGGAPTPEQRDRIFHDGKAVVLITGNVHSPEIGSSQTAVDLVYHLASDNSPETQKILDNVILLLAPSANPDGQMLVTDWYNQYLGTPSEGTNPPFLYQRYAGHDDNRDMFLFSQPESQIAGELLWHDWFPAIWLDQHQQSATGARMFVMPAADPINPNVDPLIYRMSGIYGQIQAAALEAAGKQGIESSSGYTSFWEGAMAWSGWWHNQIGLLTEAASARMATPVMQDKATPGRVTISLQTANVQGLRLAERTLPPPRDITPRANYPRPWLGGTWRLQDIVDYEKISALALLNAAADRRETVLRQIYQINESTIEAGRKGELGFGDPAPEYGILIPAAGQHDQNEVSELVGKLMMGGVEVYRARGEFRENGQNWPAGTYVIPFTQVFARYAKDLLEVQNYPALPPSADGSAADGTYDVSAWSLGMQFGVKTVFAKNPLRDTPLDLVISAPRHSISAESGAASIRFPYNGAESAVVVNRLLKAGARVAIVNRRGGDSVVAQIQPDSEAWSKATHGFDVAMKTDEAEKAEAEAGPGTTVRLPRIGLYQSWTANIDEGWTSWVLEHYEFPYTVLHNAEMQAGGLRSRFDAIILPDQTVRSLMEGQNSTAIPAQYRGGLGERGWRSLKDFVDRGGTLIALGDAANLPVDRLALPVKDLKRTVLLDQHDGPGTIVNLDIDTAHPLGWGMAERTFGFYTNSPFFQVTAGFGSHKASVAASYPTTGVKASGWMRGEDYMQGRAAVVAVEVNAGKVVLFGIRPQHRAQTHATLPMLFNALYWSVEGDRPPPVTQ